jgi:ADP-ribosylation factor-like protein 5B
MGFIFSKIWGKLRGDREYKVVIVGLANAGKTTLLYQLHLGEVVSAHPTIGSNVEEVKHNNVRLQVWDLGG